MGSCKCVERRHYIFDLRVIRKSRKKDRICFQSGNMKGYGSYSAWAGFLGRIICKGEILATEDGACVWESQGFWNPVWGDGGFYKLQDKGREILKMK